MSLSASTPDPVDWLDRLPTFDGLFPSHATSLIRSFSLFSVFRTPAPAFPDVNLLAPLVDLPPKRHVPSSIKALIGLQSFALQLKNYLVDRHQKGKSVVEVEWDKVAELLKGCVYGFYAASVIWNEETKEGDAADLKEMLKQCLDGIFLLYPILNDSRYTGPRRAILDQVEDELLSSIFPSTRYTAEILLTPLFSHATEILHTLSIHNVIARPKAGKIKTSAAKAISLPSNQDALEIMRLLEIFHTETRKVYALYGSNGTGKADEKRRPMRLSVEARVMRCDIAMSMANSDTGSIKARMGREERASDLDDEKVDDERADGGMSGRNDIVKWEKLSEEALVGCLEHAKALADNRGREVLSGRIDRSRWLKEVQSSKHLSPGLRRSTSVGPPSEPDAVSDCGGSESEDEDLHEESELSVDDIHPCPLRTLFRLHDRYEEQRLAVWLSLDTSTRAGMGTYMRGAGGRVGEAWDDLGLFLLQEYDRDELPPLGLSVDKLDKWLELASKRKVKRKHRAAKKTC